MSLNLNDLTRMSACVRGTSYDHPFMPGVWLRTTQSFELGVTKIEDATDKNLVPAYVALPRIFFEYNSWRYLGSSEADPLSVLITK